MGPGKGKAVSGIGFRGIKSTGSGSATMKIRNIKIPQPRRNWNAIRDTGIPVPVVDSLFNIRTFK
jgi:hypothetical protein